MQTNLLAKRALLATFKVGAWRASKLHKDETQEENTRHGTSELVRVSITLTKHAALDMLGKHHAKVRAEHYRLTLPSCDEGWRFLPVGREFEHASVLREAKEQHDKLVAEFLADYENERATAPARLNGLYRAEFFPPLADVAGKFRFESRYMPVPDQGTWQDWLNEAGGQASEELRWRFADALHKMVQKLGDPDATFHGTLVSNLRDLCELAGDLNLMDDPAIAAAAAASVPLSTLDPESLRSDSALRSETARQANNILTALGGKL